MKCRDHLFSTSKGQNRQISNHHPEQAVPENVDSSARASSSGAGTRKPDHNAQVQLPGDDTIALPEFYMYTLRDGSGSSAATSREENQHILELIRAYEAGGNVLPVSFPSLTSALACTNTSVYLIFELPPQAGNQKYLILCQLLQTLDSLFFACLVDE